MNSNPLSWQVTNLWLMITHIGIFTHTGDLLFYGWLRAQKGGHAKDMLVLPKSAMKVRRPSRFTALR